MYVNTKKKKKRYSLSLKQKCTNSHIFFLNILIILCRTLPAIYSYIMAFVSSFILLLGREEISITVSLILQLHNYFEKHNLNGFESSLINLQFFFFFFIEYSVNIYVVLSYCPQVCKNYGSSILMLHTDVCKIIVHIYMYHFIADISFCC